ncbi:hypothetical protein BSF42_21210 [Flavobacterium sp. ACN6]|nr:hypothetical protein BSF42_21210 [Flavobacterium sp. ACN6]
MHSDVVLAFFFISKKRNFGIWNFKIGILNIRIGI